MISITYLQKINGMLENILVFASEFTFILICIYTLLISTTYLFTYYFYFVFIELKKVYCLRILILGFLKSFLSFYKSLCGVGLYDQPFCSFLYKL